MAEILGVVSAGFSIASFTIQIAEKTNKIRHFLNDVKSAPAEIQMHLQDIQLLTEILRDFDTQRPGGFGNQRSRQCAEQCRQAANLTSDFLNDIQKIVAKRRKRGSIEFAFKRDDLEKLLRRLETIKSTLHMAHMISQMQHQAFMSEWAEYQNKMMQNLTAQVSPNVQLTSCSAETSSLSSSKPIALTKSQHRTSRRPAFRIELPIWMGGKVWEVYTSRAQVEWAFRLRTYNIIPHGSLIFRLAQDGDMDGLADLLRSNQASVFDCNPRGETALHLSAREGQVAACQFLLDRGADPCAIDRRLRTPLHYALSLAGIFWEHPRHEEWNPRLPYQQCISKLIPATQDAILDMNESFLIADEAELLRQAITFIYPPFYQRSLSERISLCGRSHEIVWSTEMIPLIFTVEERKNMSIYRQQILPFAVRQCTRAALASEFELNGYIALLASILSGYPRELAKCQVNGQSQGLIMPFLRQSLNSNRTGCPYREIEGYRSLQRRLRTKPLPLIQIWAQSLQAANIDLLQVGKLESQILAQNCIDKDMPAYTRLRQKHGRYQYHPKQDVTVRLIGFSYGAKPEEWHCWVSNFRDEYAGEFWDMVANTEPGIDMPGSWVD